MVNIFKYSSYFVAQPKFVPKAWNLASGLPSPTVAVTRAARLQCPREASSREQGNIPMLEDRTDSHVRITRLIAYHVLHRLR